MRSRIITIIHHQHIVHQVRILSVVDDRMMISIGCGELTKICELLGWGEM